MAGTKHQLGIALLLVDVVNHFEFPDGDRLFRNAIPLAASLARLKQRARAARVPVIYVNDHFGRWQSDAAKVLAYCLRAECPARKFVGPIQPDDEDYCVLKPMHSAFYRTPLDVLLRRLDVSSLVLAGLATNSPHRARGGPQNGGELALFDRPRLRCAGEFLNSCILCTAHDAKMRDYDVTVVSDCYAARTAKEHTQALDHIREMADARIVPLKSLRFDRLKHSPSNSTGHTKRKRQGDGR